MANDIIDINVYETVETVAITVNPNLTTVNINQVTGGGGSQNLQQVTDIGAVTTNAITANSFVKSGGTSSQILAADGSVITQGNNITITGGVISSVGGSGGGGSSVNYYLNGGTSQGTFGGTTYYEFSKTAVIGTGADFSRGSNGLIASFITDVADPSLLLIPAGNWNLEFFFSASSNGGSPSFYVELYKYDGTTFTLITSSSATPEGITGGTAIDAYFTPLAVPETVLTVNDRLAIRVFVNASSKTITLHTQNGHLCEVITTFTTGLTALNGLQAQVQNFATATTGTDFDIVSSESTHTFNLPSASATARGVVTTGTQTFAGAKTFASNLIIPATGSELILNVSSSGTVSGLATTTYASPFELTYLKGVTSGVQNQIDLKATKLMSAYSIRVNNTAVAANAQEVSYFASGMIPMTETISFTATLAPTLPQTQTYNWQRIGNLVDVTINLNYNLNATQVSAVIIPFPTNLPTPVIPTGYGGALNVIYSGSSRSAANFSSIAASASDQASYIRMNAANNGFEFIISSNAISAQKFSLSIKYFTA